MSKTLNKPLTQPIPVTVLKTPIDGWTCDSCLRPGRTWDGIEEHMAKHPGHTTFTRREL